MSDRTRKLVSIRRRTDQDLQLLVSRELDRGFALVDSARSRQSPLFLQAEKAHATATTLLPRIVGLNDADRLRFESRITELKATLEQVPLYANVGSYTAAIAS